jgi:RNA recognition motif-containing protein
VGYYLLIYQFFCIMNIYVGNLNYRVKEEELAKAMGAYGTVTSVKVIKDRETGKSKGFAFVEMENAEDAQAAMSALNGSEFMGRQMVIKEALPKKA